MVTNPYSFPLTCFGVKILIHKFSYLLFVLDWRTVFSTRATIFHTEKSMPEAWLLHAFPTLQCYIYGCNNGCHTKSIMVQLYLVRPLFWHIYVKPVHHALFFSLTQKFRLSKISNILCLTVPLSIYLETIQGHSFLLLFGFQYSQNCIS